VKLQGVKFKLVVIIGGVVFAIVLFLVSPFFRIQEVVIQGNVRVSEADIRNRLEVTAGSGNILMFNTSAAHSRLVGNLYIADVIFRRDLPGRLYVTVLERRLSAYVEHFGSFLYLDDFGRVLEVRSYMSESLPLLEGLRFSSFQLGEVLEVENPVDFAAVVQYTQLLIAYDLIHRISHINVADPANIRILVNYLEFHVGGIADADEKVRTIAEILRELPDAGRIRGFVNMRQLQTQYFLELLQ